MHRLSGDPAALLSSADQQLAVVDAIADAVRRLNQVADGDMGESQALDALGDKASSVASKITEAKNKLKETADAVVEYAHRLEAAQQRADRAIQAAEQAAEDRARADRRKLDAESDPAQNSLPDFATQLIRFEHAIAEQVTAAASAGLEWSAAVADKEAAGAWAASRVGAVVMGNALSTFGSWLATAWEGLMQWVRDNAELLAIIEDWASVVASWAGAIASICTLLSFIPVLNVVTGTIATIAGAVALAAGAISLLLTFALVISGSGQRTMGDLIGNAIGFAASLIPIPGMRGIAGSVAAEAGRRSGRIVATTVEIVIRDTITAHGSEIGEVVDSVATAVSNVTDPDSAAACPASPPSPIAIGPVPAEVGESGVIKAPPFFAPPHIRVNPEWVSTIGCQP